jgi:hypothetical protein
MGILAPRRAPAGPRGEAMIHLTLNTGDSRESPRREVNNTVITLLTPLIHLGDKHGQNFLYLGGE